MVTVALCAALVGALSQRITGMGFALVSAPFFVLAMGPFEGVFVANVCGAMVSGTMALQSRRDIAWSHIRWMLPASIAGIGIGAWVAVIAPTYVLDVVVGGLVLLGLGTALLVRKIRVVRGVSGAVTFGFIAGFMNASAAVGGPALSAYGIASRWEHRSFAATVQPLFFTMGLTSIIVKLLAGTVSWAVITPWEWGGFAATIAGGLVAGTMLARHIPVRIARIALIALAAAGGLSIVIRGIVGLV